MLVLQRKNGTSLLVASSRYVFLSFAAAANFLIKDVKVILARKIKRRCNSVAFVKICHLCSFHPAISIHYIEWTHE